MRAGKAEREGEPTEHWIWKQWRLVQGKPRRWSQKKTVSVGGNGVSDHSVINPKAVKGLAEHVWAKYSPKQDCIVTGKMEISKGETYLAMTTMLYRSLLQPFFPYSTHLNIVWSKETKKIHINKANMTKANLIPFKWCGSVATPSPCLSATTTPAPADDTRTSAVASFEFSWLSSLLVLLNVRKWCICSCSWFRVPFVDVPFSDFASYILQVGGVHVDSGNLWRTRWEMIRKRGNDPSTTFCAGFCPSVYILGPQTHPRTSLVN